MKIERGREKPALPYERELVRYRTVPFSASGFKLEFKKSPPALEEREAVKFSRQQ
jgi:hypothetical protein